MVLKDRSSEAQIFTVMAVVLMLALVGATGIILDATETLQETPETTSSTTPEVAKIGTDTRQAVQQLIVLANYNTSCTRCNVKSGIDNNIEPTLNNMYSTQETEVSITDINVKTGKIIKYNKSSGGSDVITTNGSQIVGGIMFTRKNVPDTNNVNNAMKIEIGGTGSSEEININVFNSSYNKEKINITVKNRTATQKEFTISPNQYNTIDIGTGTVNDVKVYAESDFYTPQSDNITEVEIKTQPASNVNTTLIAEEFDRTASKTVESSIWSVEYDIMIEGKYGYIKQTNTAYHGGRN
jgi:hypothetical protein